MYLVYLFGNQGNTLPHISYTLGHRNRKYGMKYGQKEHLIISQFEIDVHLSLKAPVTTAADDIHKYFLIVFQRK